MSSSGCCGGEAPSLFKKKAEPVKDMKTQVREGYAKIARGDACDGTTIGEGRSDSCCAPSSDASALAQAIGYNADELQNLPEGSNMGLSCGNPGAVASLKPGEVVVDLGSGGGFDAFLCGPKVGPEGRVIGIDMTPDMLDKARKNQQVYTERTGLDNVEFRMGEIEHLPLPDASVDVVISNCVINLSMEKQQVWKEISRVLKPGGRVCASDIALFKELPEGVRGLVSGWIGCVSGAVLQDTYQNHIEMACLKVEMLKSKPEYVNNLMNQDDPFYTQIQEKLPEGTTPGDFITSIDVVAYKPTRSCC